MFSVKDSEEVLNNFEIYCMEEGIGKGSIKTYLTLLNLVFEKTTVNKIRKNNYNMVFTVKNLKYMSNESKNTALRAVYLNYLNYLNKNDLIENQHIYRELREMIIQTLPSPTKNNDPKEYISKNTLMKIFSNNIIYNDSDEILSIRLITALSFFCLYNMGDIIELKINDIDLDRRMIRNIRKKEKENIVEFIYMNDYVYELIKEYMNYRKQLKNDSEIFIIKKNKKEVDMNQINGFLRVYRRVENKNNLDNDLISCRSLIRSMIYYTLINKGEDGLIFLSRIISVNQDVFKVAFNDYLEYKQKKISKEFIKEFEFVDILSLNNHVELPINKELLLTKDVEIPTFKTKRHLEDDLVYSNFDDQFLTVINRYSIENDLNIEDLEVFQMESNQNKDEKKMHIQRLVRNSSLSQKLKEYYEFRCQVCGYRVPKADSTYSAEAHHIQPYNKIHAGDDTSKNLLVLCPNCHSQFDDLYFAIEPNTYLIHSVFDTDDYHLVELTLKHELGSKYLEYAWKLFQNKKEKNLALKEF